MNACLPAAHVYPECASGPVRANPVEPAQTPPPHSCLPPGNSEQLERLRRSIDSRHATARSAIAGTRRTATAVTTPKVPSARSIAGRDCNPDCPFETGEHRSPTEPSGRTASTPETKARIVPNEHLRPSGIGRGEAAQRAAAARAQGRWEAHADFMCSVVERGEDHAQLPRRHDDASASSTGCPPFHPPHRQEKCGTVRRRRRPAAMPVLPPCERAARDVFAASSTISTTSSVDAGTIIAGEAP